MYLNWGLNLAANNHPIVADNMAQLQQLLRSHRRPFWLAWLACAGNEWEKSLRTLKLG